MTDPQPNTILLFIAQTFDQHDKIPKNILTYIKRNVLRMMHSCTSKIFVKVLSSQRPKKHFLKKCCATYFKQKRATVSGDKSFGLQYLQNFW